MFLKCQEIFSALTDSVKVTCKVHYRYSKCSLNVSKGQQMVSTFTGSVKVACKVPYRYSKCSLNVSKDQ